MKRKQPIKTAYVSSRIPLPMQLAILDMALQEKRTMSQVIYVLLSEALQARKSQKAA